MIKDHFVSLFCYLWYARLKDMYFWLLGLSIRVCNAMRDHRNSKGGNIMYSSALNKLVLNAHLLSKPICSSVFLFYFQQRCYSVILNVRPSVRLSVIKELDEM